MNKRIVLGVTGIRSEYDIMSSVFAAIEKHPQLDLQLIVTGAHLADSYGYTVKDIKNDGFKIADEIESLINGDMLSSRVKGLAIQLQGMVQTVVRVKPDFYWFWGTERKLCQPPLLGLI